MSRGPILNEAAWNDGVWLRTRSGPRPRGNAPVQVSVWHRIRDTDGFEQRPRTACGYGPREGFVWPTGGSRWEIARPGSYSALPGSVCDRCRAAPALVIESEEQVVPDAPDLDELAALVAARLAPDVEPKP